jgi:integrase
MTMQRTLHDVLIWAENREEPVDAIRALRRIPARLGMLDSDLALLPADLAHFERVVAGIGYALVSRAKNVEIVGRREDSRVRALLKRFLIVNCEATGAQSEVRSAYDDLIAIIRDHEGNPGSGRRWNCGRHRSLVILRARAACGPGELTQAEIDRIGREITAEKRKALRKAVSFLNSLRAVSEKIPALSPYLPQDSLAPPVGSSRARSMDWDALPPTFRRSFEMAADACLAGPDQYAEMLLARIESGEDPELVIAEGNAAAGLIGRPVGKADNARNQYRQSIIWLVRSWQDSGGKLDQLEDIRDVFSRTTVETAIRDQIQRSHEAPDLRDPLASQTLKSRLTALSTLAGRGLGDQTLVAIIRLLRLQHYDGPRGRLKSSTGIDTDADRIFALLRQKPELAAVWANAPCRIADVPRRNFLNAQQAGQPMREITALRQFAGAVAYALQLSRPMRTSCLRHARIASSGDVPANVLRAGPDQNILRLRFAPWEIKNARSLDVDISGSDATLLREWIGTHRARLIELQGLDSDNIYLFPGDAQPQQDSSDPVQLPRGCYAPSSFLDLWADASAILGVEETPHRLRHIVAVLILAAYPGDYARVAAILGNAEDVARRHYGRDDGEAAARHARAAILSAHPDVFKQLRGRRPS